LKKLLTKKENKVNDLYNIYALFVFVAMLAACILTGLGEDFRYLIYGRYFEYSAIPIVAVGILGLRKGVHVKQRIFFVTVINTVLVFLSWLITKTYPSNSLSVDTNRLAGITGITTLTNEYVAVLLFGAIMIIVLGACISSTMSKRVISITVCIMLLITFGFSDIRGLKAINKAHVGGERDWKLLEKYTSNEDIIYFVADETSNYWSFYTRLQVMIFDKEMIIISYDELCKIDSDSYIVTMTSGEVYEEMQEEYALVDQGHSFALFEKSELE
jgi:hypothetical protein